jgi:hypothetical protein
MFVCVDYELLWSTNSTGSMSSFFDRRHRLVVGGMSWLRGPASYF